MDKLATCKDDHDLRRLQGKVQEIDEILELPKRAADYIGRSK